MILYHELFDLYTVNFISGDLVDELVIEARNIKELERKVKIYPLIHTTPIYLVRNNDESVLTEKVRIYIRDNDLDNFSKFTTNILEIKYKTIAVPSHYPGAKGVKLGAVKGLFKLFNEGIVINDAPLRITPLYSFSGGNKWIKVDFSEKEFLVESHNTLYKLADNKSEFDLRPLIRKYKNLDLFLEEWQKSGISFYTFMFRFLKEEELEIPISIFNYAKFHLILRLYKGENAKLKRSKCLRVDPNTNYYLVDLGGEYLIDTIETLTVRNQISSIHPSELEILENLDQLVLSYFPKLNVSKDDDVSKLLEPSIIKDWVEM